MRSVVVVVAFLWLQITASLASLEPRLALPIQAGPLTLPINSLRPRDIIGANGQEGSGLVPVSMATDRQSYFTVIQAGEIHFRVALDTASSDLWIVSSECETDQCKSVPRYPLPYQSATFVSVEGNATVFNASYADGTSASGFVAKETIKLANLSIPEQHFGLVTESNVTFIDQVSGILGLGFPRLSSISRRTNSTPFFPTLAYKGLLEYPLFALSLTKNHTGSLSLGAIDASVVNNTNQISWNRVASFPPFVNEANETSANYLQWAIPLASFAVNGTTRNPVPTYPFAGGGRSLALIDVGASGITGPLQDVSTLFSMIPGSRLVDSDVGQWAIPCDTVVPITFTFGTVSYTLLPEDYIIGPASGNPNSCLAWPRASAPHSDGIDWQFGAPFLRTVYSIYSFGIDSKESPLIGFYQLRNATEIANLTQSQTPESISAYLSSISATISTTLPNVLLPTPTYTTPPYTMNTSIPASVGAIVTSGLATSTYSAIFGTHTSFNASAIPTISPEPSIFTSVVTDPSGQVSTSVYTSLAAVVTLGIPPGWSAGVSLKDATLAAKTTSVLLFLCTALFWTDNLPLL